MFPQIYRNIYGFKIWTSFVLKSIIIIFFFICFNFLLQASTCDFLRTALNIQNVSLVYDVASLFCLSGLAQACFTYMDRKAPEVLASDGFLTLSKVWQKWD